MKKKIFAVLLCGLLLIGLAGCGKKESKQSIGDDLNELMDSLEKESNNFHVSVNLNFIITNDFKINLT